MEKHTDLENIVKAYIKSVEGILILTVDSVSHTKNACSHISKFMQCDIHSNIGGYFNTYSDVEAYVDSLCLALETCVDMTTRGMHQYVNSHLSVGDSDNCHKDMDKQYADLKDTFNKYTESRNPALFSDLPEGLCQGDSYDYHDTLLERVRIDYIRAIDAVLKIMADIVNIYVGNTRIEACRELLILATNSTCRALRNMIKIAIANREGNPDMTEDGISFLTDKGCSDIERLIDIREQLIQCRSHVPKNDLFKTSTMVNR